MIFVISENAFHREENWLIRKTHKKRNILELAINSKQKTIYFRYASGSGQFGCVSEPRAESKYLHLFAFELSAVENSIFFSISQNTYSSRSNPKYHNIVTCTIWMHNMKESAEIAISISDLFFCWMTDG